MAFSLIMTLRFLVDDSTADRLAADRVWFGKELRFSLNRSSLPSIAVFSRRLGNLGLVLARAFESARSTAVVPQGLEAFGGLLHGVSLLH
jgi:hypothetical protein